MCVCVCVCVRATWSGGECGGDDKLRTALKSCGKNRKIRKIYRITCYDVCILTKNSQNSRFWSKIVKKVHVGRKLSKIAEKADSGPKLSKSRFWSKIVENCQKNDFGRKSRFWSKIVKKEDFDQK